MPDRARSAFFIKNLKYLGRVRLDSVRTGRAAGRHLQGGRTWPLPVLTLRAIRVRYGAFCCRPSGKGPDACPAVRAVLGEVPVVSDMTGYGVPAPWLGRSLAVKRRTVLRTVAGRIKKVVPSWEIRINLCNFVIRGVVSFREGGSCGSFCFT